ncbi:FAD-binding monooxygenase ktnD [Lachnellula suecica]|uniref:FAD-binding monooxygenase ktnD n=1 Tax=Lachnellula suecica TaxID=602035 RepID=A0A8T9C3D7_9HELO|nr:FAD-binding monooxygenase ktnD [Lachnellula suecica]
MESQKHDISQDGHPEELYSRCKVLIIGAGESGIAVGCSLKQKHNFDNFRIVDRQSSVPGGSINIPEWPATPTVAYSYSFAPYYTHTSIYSSGQDFLRYLEGVVKKFGIRDNIQLNADVTGLRYIAEENEWEAKITHFVEGFGDLSSGDQEQLLLDLPAGQTWAVGQETVRAKIAISCVGILVEPNTWPDGIPKNQFEGQIIHPARWPKDIDLKRKDVTIVGGGCTAAQIVPTILEEPWGVKSVTQIIRSPPHTTRVIPTPFGEGTYSEIAPIVFKYVPFLGWVARLILFLTVDLFIFMVTMKRKNIKTRAFMENDSWERVTSVIPKKYHAMMKPRYPYGAKRLIGAPKWFTSMNNPRFTLTNKVLKEAKGKTVVLAGGKDDTDSNAADLTVAADVLILANGYKATQFLHPLAVYGRSNKSIQDVWTERRGPQAYMGLALDDFPNFFMITGPNTYTGHWSVILASENMTNYMLKIIKPVLNGEALYAEVKRPAAERWNRKIRKELGETVFEDSKSWYRDESGWNSVVCPHSQIEATIRYTFPRYSDWNIAYVAE